MSKHEFGIDDILILDRLILGSYAIESIRDRLRSITEELEDWKHLHFPLAAGELDEEKEDKDMKEEEDGEGSRDAGT